MNYLYKLIIITLSAGICITVANANAPTEREELLGIKNTIVNLIDELVVAGVLEEEKADLMKQRAEAKAKLQAAQEAQEDEELQAAQKAADEDAVRVQFVPEHVKQEIRDQVRSELKQEVVDEVLADAKNEILGVPDLIPDWMKKLRIYGDFRIRYETDKFSDDNDFDLNNNGIRDGFPPDILALNDSQLNINVAELSQDPNRFFRNRERTRNQLRERIRFGISTEITDNLEFGMRITAGNIANPVSVNQTLGNDGRRFDAQIDRGFIKYSGLDENQYNWLNLYTGRFKNPFFRTDLVFDNDLGFEGFALQFKKNLAGNDSLLALEDDSKTFFATIGAFAIDEIEVSSQDKWLLGGQFGSELVFKNQSRAKFAVSYYDYVNIRGRRNQAEDIAGSGVAITFQPNDFTAPGFSQGGNSLFDIRNDFDSGGSNLDDVSALYGLASDFNLLNLTASYDWASLAPIHVVFTGDIVKNFGFDKDEIINRSREGGNEAAAQIIQEVVVSNPEAQLTERTWGYHLSVAIGWPSVFDRGNWQVFGSYKYLQRDAVLDAFTDSNYSLGGTNVKGFMLGGRYALLDNTWLQGRWFSTDSIDGPNNGIDILQFDLNAKF